MFERRTTGSPIAALQDMIQRLTYGEMMMFCQSIGADPQKVHAWVQPMAKLPTASNDNPVPTTGQI